MDEILEQAVKKVFKDVAKKKYMDLDKDGLYGYELYADYDEWFSDRAIAKMLDCKEPMDAFYEELFDAYTWTEFDIEAEILELIEKLVKQYVPEDSVYRRGLLPDEIEEVREYIQENMYFVYPEEHYLKQEVKVDIKLDTGDCNYEYTINCIQPAWNGCSIDEIKDESSLVWLTKQQGYSKEDLKNILRAEEIKNPKGFLESMQCEVACETSYCNAMIILVKMTLKDLLDLGRLVNMRNVDDLDKRPDCGTIVIGKNARLGLVDTWEGGGSELGIELEKDIDLPINLIYEALPDGAMRHYSIDGIFGLCDDQWVDCIKAIIEPAKVEETA